MNEYMNKGMAQSVLWQKSSHLASSHVCMCTQQVNVSPKRASVFVSLRLYVAKLTKGQPLATHHPATFRSRIKLAREIIILNYLSFC